MNFSVSLWWRNPETEEGEDCCSMEQSFATESEARECLKDLDKHFLPSEVRTCGWVILDGPSVHEIFYDAEKYKRFKQEKKYLDAGERSEARWQAGMLGGTEAYNAFEG